MSKKVDRILKRMSEYEESVEDALESDTIDTTENINKIEESPDTSKSNLDYDTLSDTSSDTSIYSESDTSTDSNSDVDLEFFGSIPNNSNISNLDPNYFLSMYQRSMNIPILDPMYQQTLLEYGRNITGDPLYGFGYSPSCRVRLSSTDSKYLDHVIRVHNGLQELLKAMCDDAIKILGLNMPKVQTILINREDFSLDHLGNFISMLCHHKRSMLHTMDLVNSTYNTIITHLERNPDERTPEDSKKLAIINYNWNSFLANYLPLVPTADDEEHFQRTGTHRELKIENILPKMTSPYLTRSLKGGGLDDAKKGGGLDDAKKGGGLDDAKKGGSLDNANQKARDVMKRIREFVSESESSAKIDIMPVTHADAEKRRMLMLDATRETENAVRTGMYSSVGNTKEISVINPTERIRANELVDVVQSIQNLEGSNNLLRMSTVPDFTVEYSEVNIDQPLKSYISNLKDINTENFSDVSRKLRDDIEYDYSNLSLSNLKLVNDPFIDVTVKRSNINNELQILENKRKVNAIIKDIKKSFYDDLEIRNELKNILDTFRSSGGKIKIDDVSPNLISVLENIRKFFMPDDLIDENCVDTMLKALKNKIGKRWTINLTANEINGTQEAQALIDKASEYITTVIANLSFKCGNKEYKFKQFKPILSKVNRYLGNKHVHRSIDIVLDQRNDLTKIILPEVVTIVITISDVLNQLDNELLVELGILSTTTKSNLKTDDELLDDVNKLKHARDELKINELAELDKTFISSILGVGKVKNIGFTMQPQKLVNMFGGNDNEGKLKQLLEQADADMRKMSNSLFDTITNLDTSKVNLSKNLTADEEIVTVMKGLNDHLNLVESIASGIISGKIMILKYLRLSVLLEARNNFQKIGVETDDYYVTLHKSIRLIDRIEQIIGDSEKNVVEISTDTPYRDSFIPLVVLYFMIVCLKDSDGDLDCLSD